MAVSPGLLHYSHEKGEKGGSLSLKFNLVDPEGNKLIDQSFFISVLGNAPSTPPPLPPSRRSHTKQLQCWLFSGGGFFHSFSQARKAITAHLSLLSRPPADTS